jgi:hypothetical protein
MKSFTHSRIVVVLHTFFFFLCLNLNAQHANKPVKTGSYIINMGITPQTRNNGLRPYGFIYELIRNRTIPVKWVINPTKAKDGNDFHHNGIYYKGSAFIIDKEFISPTIQTLITSWNSLGVVGAYTTYDTVLPVYATITSWPRSVLDFDNGDIASKYYEDALIPETSYSYGVPSSLNLCNDLFVMPHADPTWATHSNFHTFVTTNKGYVWAACHAVSVLESITNPGNTIQLNFLSGRGLQCFGNNDCNAITQVHAGNPTLPTTFLSSAASDPVSQFMGDMVPATNNGSEQWYIPISTGTGWNNDVKKIIRTADGTTGKEGVKLIYGHAYSNNSNGKVMYQGGHDHGGNGVSNIAAQRAFFNFVLMTGEEKKPQLSFTSSVRDTLVAGNTVTFGINIAGGTPPYTYQWSSSCGGIFSAPTAGTTSFTVPNTADSLTCVIRCQVADACQRWNFEYKVVKVYSGYLLKTGLSNFSAKKTNGTVTVKWQLQVANPAENITVERSTNGSRFEALTEQPATADAGIFTDNNLPTAEYLYYRLKISGKESSSYSDVIKINNLNTALHIAPNPVQNTIRVSGIEGAGKAAIKIFDMSGKQVYTTVVQTVRGEAVVNGLSIIRPGIYIVEITSGSFTQREKIIIRN